MQAYKDMNTGAFTDAIFAYDQISKLEPWRTKCVVAAAAAGGGTGAARVLVLKPLVVPCCLYSAPAPARCRVLLMIKKSMPGATGGASASAGGATGGAGTGEIDIT